MDKRRMVAVLCTLALAIGCLAGTQAEQAKTAFQDASSGALHVEGTTLCDSDGKDVQRRGVSIHGLSLHPEHVHD